MPALRSLPGPIEIRHSRRIRGLAAAGIGASDQMTYGVSPDGLDRGERAGPTRFAVEGGRNLLGERTMNKLLGAAVGLTIALGCQGASAQTATKPAAAKPAAQARTKPGGGQASSNSARPGPKPGGGQAGKPGGQAGGKPRGQGSKPTRRTRGSGPAK